MNKELTPLEALNNLTQYLTGDYRDCFKELSIIETALKILDQLQVIIGAEKIEDLPELALETENDWYSARYNLKEAEKKLKALEIIKEKSVNLEFLKCSENYEQYCLICSYGNEISKEEYDLLKEVLL